MGGLFFAMAMQCWDLYRWIALYAIRFVGTALSRIILRFTIATAFLSA